MTDIKNRVIDSSKTALIKTAKHYVNMACPLFTYQPKVGDELKKQCRMQKNK